MEYIYASLLLHKLGKEVTEENVKNVITASGAQPNEASIKSLIASLKGVEIDKELENASLVAAVPAVGTVAPHTEKKEEKPKEEKKEAAAEGLSALFG